MYRKNKKTYTGLNISGTLGFLFFICSLLLTGSAHAQTVSARVDSTRIKIGEQIKYQIEVNAETDDLVVFPEGNTFSPLEVVES
ncbi:MAG: hypothetical protein KJO51_02510 [Gramella sp.]|nr:hypothetical protein [Christiangramia sp.]